MCVYLLNLWVINLKQVTVDLFLVYPQVLLSQSFLCFCFWLLWLMWKKKKESETFMSQRKHFWVLDLPLYGLVFFEILTLLLQSFDSFLIFVRYFFGIFHSFKKLSSWRELQKLFYIFISKRIRIMTNNVYLIRIINPH